jgi:hypothetical protein
MLLVSERLIGEHQTPYRPPARISASTADHGRAEFDATCFACKVGWS